MSKFTEAQLEQAIIELLGRENYPQVLGKTLWTPDLVLGDGKSKSIPLSASRVTVKANQYHYSSFRRKPESSKTDTVSARQ